MTTCLACDTQLDRDAYLCAACTQHTAARLNRMTALYAALAAWLAPSGRRAAHGAGSRSDAPLPVRTDVLSLRGPGGIVGLLEDWRAAMQRDRGWSEPAISGSIEDRIRAAARGLALNLDWIAASWPAAGDLARELRELERSVLTVIDPPEPTVRLGNCPATVDDGTCGAVLRVPAGPSTFSCRWCGTTYGPTDWMKLARAQIRTQTAEEAAA